MRFILHLKNLRQLIDLLTENRRRHYSGGMITDFHQLAEKVSELAALTQSLRLENADLRMSLAKVGAENAELTQRIDEAYKRVSALLDKIPSEDKQEAA